MDEEVIGRGDEKAILDSIVSSSTASLTAVYGRRRVGKTYLIRTYLKKQVLWNYSGVHNVSTEVQLEEFAKSLSTQLNNNIALPIPANWFAALDVLKTLVAPKLRRKKNVIFFDEFPWMQTSKSNFLPAFENFWNSWASLQNNLAVIICGSAASWMIKNVVRNRGGLHNRITHKIPLQPFTLHETAQFLLHKKINLSQYQITQLYMAMGGIPHYLNQIKGGLSAAQIIDSACFSKNGFLYNEFNDLCTSLFDGASRHIKVIRALAGKPTGLSRNEIIKTCKLQSGGSTTALLDELAASGFIKAYIPMGKQTKAALFKLTDEYSLFYLKFMEPNRVAFRGTWLQLSDTPGWKSWSGLAFESICLKHTEAIKSALGISGMYSENCIWKSNAVQQGNAPQIDLVINRRDNCINLCEIKFYENEFTIDKKYAMQLENKKHQFKIQTKTKKHLFITIISTYPLQQNINSIGLIDHCITLDKLFDQKSL
jgi:AAA+ ATPase superfamily predicted ATPase